jgi:hypothetical protein
VLNSVASLSTKEGISHPPVLRTPLVRIPLRVVNGACGVLQPINAGVPLPRGLCFDDLDWLTSWNEVSSSCQTEVLSRWPDGSCKWLSATFFNDLTIEQGSTGSWLYGVPKLPAPSNSRPSSECHHNEQGVSVKTGFATFRLERDSTQLLSSVEWNGRLHLGAMGCRIVSRDARGGACPVRYQRMSIREAGPLRTVVDFRGTLDTRNDLRFSGTLSFFSGTGLVRLELTAENPRRAKHPDGYWDLGDPGSILVKDLAVEVNVIADDDRRIEWLENPEGPIHESQSAVFEIYQDSSGGENWNSRNHVNRCGRIATSFCGYRVRTSDTERYGKRASPIVSLKSEKSTFTCALEDFWQQCPGAIEVNGSRATVRLWPEQYGDLHELQAGEHNTRIIWLNFSEPSHAPHKELEWVHHPTIVVADPEWIAKSRVIPFLPSTNAPRRPEATAIVHEALEGSHSLFAKREVIDEYGWRNYGDVWADHETAYYDGPPPVISHYNNQYDLLHSLLIQFLLTGDPHWWDLAAPLARHVIDIDIYHTDRDKPAYNGGLFWHTAHYHDAGTSTHRCMSASMRGKSIPAPGTGPCNEHNYTSGLLLYHCLTGCQRAREAVLYLARWVIEMDDGKRSILGAVSYKPTGDASRTFSSDYHGPGRGAGNSINALLDAWLLTNERQFLAKAEVLIRRCIHPCDDLTARDLGNAEVRWSYTVCLQSLWRFLEQTKGIPDLQALHAYIEESCLHYARWMVQHESFYLDTPERLEYPTETWAAQELRKGNVLLMAARYLPPPDADECRVRGQEILDRAWTTLLSYPTHHFARPIALALQQSYVEDYLSSTEPRCSSRNRTGGEDFGQPVAFVSQKAQLRADVRSLSGICRMFGNAFRPSGWANVWRQSWLAERCRRLI